MNGLVFPLRLESLDELESCRASTLPVLRKLFDLDLAERDDRRGGREGWRCLGEPAGRFSYCGGSLEARVEALKGWAGDVCRGSRAFALAFALILRAAVAVDGDASSTKPSRRSVSSSSIKLSSLPRSDASRTGDDAGEESL